MLTLNFASYADANEGYYPSRGSTIINARSLRWNAALAEHSGIAYDSSDSTWWTKMEVLFCPKTMPTPSGSQWKSGYGVMQYGPCLLNGSTGTSKQERIASPSITVLVADSTDKSDTRYGSSYIPDYNYTGSSTDYQALGKHNKQINIGFCDGHVGSTDIKLFDDWCQTGNSNLKCEYNK